MGQVLFCKIWSVFLKILHVLLSLLFHFLLECLFFPLTVWTVCHPIQVLPNLLFLFTFSFCVLWFNSSFSHLNLISSSSVSLGCLLISFFFSIFTPQFLYFHSKVALCHFHVNVGVLNCLMNTYSSISCFFSTPHHFLSAFYLSGPFKEHIYPVFEVTILCETIVRLMSSVFSNCHSNTCTDIHCWCPYSYNLISFIFKEHPSSFWITSLSVLAWTMFEQNGDRQNFY